MRYLLPLPLILAALGAGPAGAGPVAVTDFDRYLTLSAGLGPETVVGFDLASTPTDIPEGGSFGTLTFSALDLAGAVPSIVARGGATSSNANALETDFGTFVGGDGFTLTLAAPVHAFGLFVITADTLGDGAVSLSLADIVVESVAANAMVEPRLSTDFDFSPGTNARMYFLGAVSDVLFSTVALNSDVNGSFAFALDDVRYATPVPATSALLLAGIVLLRRAPRRRGSAGDRHRRYGSRLADRRPPLELGPHQAAEDCAGPCASCH
jgi:hypothetical protein